MSGRFMSPLPLLAASLLTVAARADLIVHYAFDGATLAPATTLPGVTAGNITPGTAFNTDDGLSTVTTPADGGSHSYFGRGTSVHTATADSSSGFTAATSQGNYFQFTLSTAGQMNLTSLGFDTSKNEFNTHSFRILVTSDLTSHAYNNRLNFTAPATVDTSLPNVIESQVAGDISDAPAGLGSNWGNGDNALVDLNVPAFQGVSAVTFRVYAYTLGQPAGTANIANVIRFDNVLVNGSVVPEPASAALILLALPMLLRRRR
jgi:hypothetical protein